MRVLVLTQAPEVLLPCRVNLEFAGHEVMVAGSAFEGARRAREEQPDVIALDVSLLPDGGFALLWQLSLHRATSEMPVILIADPGDGNGSGHNGSSGAAGLNGSNGSIHPDITAGVLTPTSPGGLPEAIWRLASTNGAERSVRRPSRLAVSLLTRT